MMEFSLRPAVLIVLAVMLVTAIVKRWITIAHARHDEIRRRERLRILLRPEDPRK